MLKQQHPTKERKLISVLFAFGKKGKIIQCFYLKVILW